MDERLKKQLAFSLEIDKEKNIFRQTHISGHGRNENDAEHAWHMAIMAYLLREYSNEPVDIAKVMLMCLIHDIVEIDAGDTYAYDEDRLKTQKAREDAAKERIFSLLPEDQKTELMALFDEFEEYETAEARFAHAMDNLQPLMLNDSNGGADWREHKVTSEQVYGRQRKTKLGAKRLYEVTDKIIKENIEKGNIKEYKFWGWEHANVPAITDEYNGIKTPRDLYDALSDIWCAETCAPRLRTGWTKDNMTLGQCSITAFLTQDIFGGKVYGILRPGGNYHCYNVIGEVRFDLTSEQFGDEILDYDNNPEQLREIHFAKDEKRLRYEYLKKALKEYTNH